MNYSQGFIDGYEGNEYNYSISSYQYFDDFHKGRTYREIHLKIFENHNHDCCYDLKADEFQMRNTQAIALMNDW